MKRKLWISLVLEIVLLFAIAAGIVFSFTGCAGERLIYRPEPLKLSGANQEEIKNAFLSLAQSEAILKTLESEAKTPLISATNHSFLVNKEYFQAFLKKDLELARLALMFQSVLQIYFSLEVQNDEKIKNDP